MSRSWGDTYSLLFLRQKNCNSVSPTCRAFPQFDRISMVTYNAGVTSAEYCLLCNDNTKHSRVPLYTYVSVEHPGFFIVNCETVLLTHQLLARVCSHTLRNTVARSSFKFLQGVQQFLLLPEHKDDILSSSVFPNLHIRCEAWLSIMVH